MARVPRREQVDPNEIGLYHCYSRCVRGQYLIAEDDGTGEKDEHRKLWIEERQSKLAAVFSMELIGYAILDNHLHQVIRTRPDLLALWSDEEVVRRWRTIHPLKREDGSVVELTSQLMAGQLQDQQTVAVWRERLGSLSWFMKELKEPIAKRANAESGVTGSFWDGHFKSPRLLDSVALLLCLLYVDLNPIRAKLAETPEQSVFTSVYRRICARQQRAGRSGQPVAEAPPDLDACLIPILEDGEPDNLAAPRYRASDQGVLPITLDRYLQLLDWTGREIRADKRGAIPGHLAPIIDRLGVREGFWLEAIDHFGCPFRRALGGVQAMVDTAARVGLQWLRGVGPGRDLLNG